uniref:tRNA-dihydrouridine synthase n=1 Tax=Arcella intermedia TaxID=1963864 RepID=A0A6B2L820_9EUKA
MIDELQNLYNDKKILAPLVGGSDLSFRLLCRKYGAQVTFTEMCIAEYYLMALEEMDNKKKLKGYTFEFEESDRPLILQLAGNTAQPIIKLANHQMFKGHIDGVDLNCGCPQSFAMEKGYGAGMLNDAQNLIQVCSEIVQNISYPLSVKLRIYQDVPTTINIMKQLRDVGVKAFTVHGREWWQKGDKRGHNDWNAIRQIKEELPDVWIIGNGDIYKHEDFQKFKDLSGVHSLMSGYGALTSPWIFSLSPTAETLNQTLADCLNTYLQIASQHHNKWIDVLRHTGWMLKKHIPLSPELVKQFRTKLYECKNMEDVRALLGTLTPAIVISVPEGEHVICYPSNNIAYGKKRRVKKKEEKDIL